MTRSDAVTVMLALAEGQPYQPVQIQKAMFLLTDKMPHLIEDKSYSFRPYDYGPFDEDVYRDIGRAEQQGLATIATGGRWKTYSATQVGVARAKELLALLNEKDVERLRKIASLVRRLSFSDLVKAIYAAYPNMRANSVFTG